MKEKERKKQKVITMGQKYIQKLEREILKSKEIDHFLLKCSDKA